MPLPVDDAHARPKPDEIEVTEEMYSAGSDAMMPFYIGEGVYDLSEPCLAAMYRAMRRAEKTVPTHEDDSEESNEVVRRFRACIRELEAKEAALPLTAQERLDKFYRDSGLESWLWQSAIDSNA